MDNVIEFNEFAAPACHAGDEACCWICQKGNPKRALFCQYCGTIQPVRPIDHFARLGLERRIDIDFEVLERQYGALTRALSPERFAIRGLGERNHAAKQLEAVEEAYQTLRDPLRRGRYWLALHGKEATSPTISENPLVMELRQDLDSAGVPSQCDRVAQRAGQAMEQGIVGLMQALRSQNWPLANAMLAEVEGLGTILNDVRSCRATIMRQQNETPVPWSRDDLTTVK